MNPIDPWIATFVERCLSFYLGDSHQDDIELTNDGTALRFKISGFTPRAAIAEVGHTPVKTSTAKR